jgi:ubiquinone biosynthesis protein
MLRSSALEVGMGGEEVDPDLLDRAFARLMADHLGPGAEPTAALLQEFLGITNRFGLRMPTSVTEMLRALATLQGSLEVLSPDYPVIDAARSMATDRADDVLNPENLAEQAKREVIRVAPLLRRMPHHLDRIAGQIEKGNLSVRVSMFSNPEDLRALSGLLNRFVLAFIGASLGVVSVMLLQTDGGASITDNVGLFDLLGVGGLFAGAILIMRVVLEVLRES